MIAILVWPALIAFMFAAAISFMWFSTVAFMLAYLAVTTVQNIRLPTKERD